MNTTKQLSNLQHKLSIIIQILIAKFFLLKSYLTNGSVNACPRLRNLIYLDGFSFSV